MEKKWTLGSIGTKTIKLQPGYNPYLSLVTITDNVFRYILTWCLRNYPRASLAWWGCWWDLGLRLRIKGWGLNWAPELLEAPMNPSVGAYESVVGSLC